MIKSLHQLITIFAFKVKPREAIEIVYLCLIITHKIVKYGKGKENPQPLCSLKSLPHPLQRIMLGDCLHAIVCQNVFGKTL